MRSCYTRSIGLLLFTAAYFFAGCRKKEHEKEIHPLINKKWVIESIYKHWYNGPTWEIFAQRPEKIKDDYFFFYPDSTFELNDNIIRREPGSPVLESGIWSLRDGQLILIYTYPQRHLTPYYIYKLSPNHFSSIVIGTADSTITNFKVIP